MAIHSIGSGLDYETTTLWFASIPTTMTEDRIGQLSGVETVSDNSGSPPPLTFTGKTVGVYTLRLEAASGEGLDGFSSTDPLQYTSGKGGAIVTTDPVNNSAVVIQSGMTLKQIQIYRSTTNNYGTELVKCSGTIDSCLIQADASLNGNGRYILGLNGPGQRRAVNCVIISNHVDWTTAIALTDYYGSGCEVRNCTALRDSDLASGDTGIDIINGTTHVAINTLVLGSWATDWDATGWTGSSYNASDSTGSPGTNTIDSLTAADEVESISAPDARLKSGTSLAAGTRDQTYTNDLDIIGQSRDTSTPCIGAWELVSGSSIIPQAMNYYARQMRG